MTQRRQAAGDDSARLVLRDLAQLGGAGAVVVDLARGPEAAAPGEAGAVRIGVCRSGPLPVAGLDACDILLSADPAAPRPWVGVAADRLEQTLEDLRACVERQATAAAVAAQVTRVSLTLTFEDALVMESIGYSMLLASEGFGAWRAATPRRERARTAAPRVLVDQEGETLRIRLNRADVRNAFDARMRDELAEALAFAAAHPDSPPVVLSGLGPAFSAGGDLDEFGQADDVGRAHLIRTLRSPARLVHRLGARLTARVHGPCVGAGIEVSAAAAKLIAAPGATFRLPEVSMGLIPGAGGVASIPRRIGRRRACYMAISGADIDLETALAWGLVDAVEPAA